MKNILIRILNKYHILVLVFEYLFDLGNHVERLNQRTIIVNYFDTEKRPKDVFKMDSKPVLELNNSKR